MTCFFTFAYNAQDTIDRTVKSVLNQTCGDWVYYLCDNGSTDLTRSIIEEYAQKDPRIIPIYMDVNNPYEASQIGFAKIFGSNNDYFCMVDSDDEYKPDFLEKALAFMADNNLDAVAVGSDFIEAGSLKLCGIRQLNGNLILDKSSSYNEYLGIYHQFFRTIWGKLYNIKLFQQFDFTNENWEYYRVAYGGDTLFCMKAFSYAKRVGILAGSYHKYYLSHKSSSYQWNRKRVESDIILLDDARNFLILKVGYVSPRNNEFLLCVYMNAMLDTLNVLLKAELDDSARLDSLCEMFLCPHAKELAAHECFGALLGDVNGQTQRRKELFAIAAVWLLSREEVADEQVEKYCELGEFLCAACENGQGWLTFKQLRVQFLLENGRENEAKPLLAELDELMLR